METVWRLGESGLISYGRKRSLHRQILNSPANECVTQAVATDGGMPSGSLWMSKVVITYAELYWMSDNELFVSFKERSGVTINGPEHTLETFCTNKWQMSNGVVATCHQASTPSGQYRVFSNSFYDSGKSWGRLKRSHWRVKYIPYYTQQQSPASSSSSWKVWVITV